MNQRDHRWAKLIRVCDRLIKYDPDLLAALGTNHLQIDPFGVGADQAGIFNPALPG
jgi:hypothetical protein